MSIVRKFKVARVQQKRWWSFPRFRGTISLLLSVVHDNPNDWPLVGQVKLDVGPHDVDFAEGDIVTVTIEADDG